MRLLVLLVGMLWFGSLTAHPLHLSVVNLDYSEADSSLAITVKVFHDDFTIALNFLYGDKVNLSQPISQEKEELWAAAYFNRALVLMLDGDSLDFSGLQQTDRVLEENALWLKYKCHCPPPQQVAVTNKILHEVYFDQQNIFFYKQEEVAKNYMFSYRDVQFDFLVAH